MYYVKRGRKDFFVARGPKYVKWATVGDIHALGMFYFDYDDPERWNDLDLLKESKIVEDENNEGYDLAATVAVHGEINRRAGKDAPPWFDYFDDLVTGMDDMIFEADYMTREEGNAGHEAENAGWKADNPAHEADIGAQKRDNNCDRKPIVIQAQVDPAARVLIKKLADLEKERWAGEKPSIDEMCDLQFKLMNTKFAQLVCEGFDYVEDQKSVAAHLMFLYSQERHMATQEGREPNEDFLLAGSSLYNFAAIKQMMEEEEGRNIDNDDNMADDDIDDDNIADDDDMADDFIFPQNMDMEELEKAAESFSNYVNNLEADALGDMEEATEWFLKDKGFFISTLSGCRAAQAWLEKAQPEDAFVTEGPIDNAIDWHLGKARLDSMLKIVKARIKKLEGE